MRSIFRGSSGRSLERLTPLLGAKRVSAAVELPLENAIEAVHGELDAVIGDAVLGEVVRPDLLGALAGADLRPPRCRLFRGLLLALELVEARAQDAQRLRLVLELRFLVLHGDHEPGRQVRDADGAVRGVDALAAGAGRPVDVDLEL